MELTLQFKNKVFDAIIQRRENYTGSDANFAKSLGISASIFSRLKKGERDRILAEGQWLELGRRFDVRLNERKWITAKTDVFKIIEQDIMYCKSNSKAMICVDEVGIGKSYAAKYLAKTLKNTFYIDAKQAKTRQAFIRLIAKTVGVDSKGRYLDIKENLKYYLTLLPEPMIIIDDSGYLEYPAYMELLELWDATEGMCGWYQIGDDSLREKIERGMNNKKVGYKAIFSRYSKRFTTITPTDRLERENFYKKLIREVMSANMTNQDNLNTLVKKCLITDEKNSFGDLRRAESLIILSQVS